jgi:hypothetical protein
VRNLKSGRSRIQISILASSPWQMMGTNAKKQETAKEGKR